jgi:hypothetical protein
MLAEIVWDMETLFVAGGCTVAIVGTVAHFWAQVERAKSDNELKRRLVEQGKSAEEIERIISAKSPKD